MRLKPSYPRIDNGHPLSSKARAFLSFTELNGQPASATDPNIIFPRLGGESWVTGAFGPAMNFPSGTSVGLSRNGAIFSGSESRTIVARIRIDGAINANGNGIFSIDPETTGANGERWSFRLSAGRVLRIEIQGSGYTSGLAVNAGEWATVSCSLGGSQLQHHTLGLNGKYEQATGTNAVATNSVYLSRIGTFADNSISPRNLLGDIDWIGCFSSAMSNSEIDELAADPFAMFRPRQRSYFALFGAAPAGPTYTLTADAGIFALTGIDAGLQASRLLTADVGSFALTGIDAGLFVNRSLTADAGSFALTGIDAGLFAGRRLASDAGSFALTGIDAGLIANRLLGADAGAFALTGIDADLTYSGSVGPTYTLTCDAGSFALTGNDTGLLANRRIAADAGAFTLTGIDAAFVVNRRLAADTGAFVLTGIDANLTYSGATSSSASIYYYLMMGS